MPTFSLHTLGCRANQADSQQLSQILIAAGFSEVPFGQPADCQIVNTCTVTAEADRKSAQFARRAERNGGQVIVTGCGAAQRGGAWKRVSGSTLRLPPESREQILEHLGAQHCPNGESFERPLLRRDRVRSLLRIQDGCDQFCTFCIVPYVRGRSRSKSADWVVGEVQKLEGEGCAEVVLSGIHLSAWGTDLEPAQDLSQLAAQILQATKNIRVRFGSVEPDLFPKALIELMSQNARLCPHLHLVLQHASDKILEKMHRGYQLSQYQELVENFQKVPNFCLSTDVLVGFPGEQIEDFQKLLQYLRKTPFSKIHVFPYSSRPGTAASKFPNAVPASLLEFRRQALLSLAKRKHLAYLRGQRGKLGRVLIEAAADRAGWVRGTTENYVTVEVRGGLAQRGSVVEVELGRRRGEVLIGRLCSGESG